MDAVNNKLKYKILISILLGEYVLTQVLSAMGVDLKSKSINIIAVIIFVIPVMLLLNTVSKDTRFNSYIRSIAKITMWAVGVCAAGGFLVEYAFLPT